MTSWLEALRPQMEAKIREMLERQTFSPALVFDFDHVKAAVDIVEAAISETQAVAQQAGTARALDAVARAGAAAAAGKHFSFIDEGVMTGNATILWNAHLTFPRILRASLFIAVCAHVEHVLRAWCRWLHREWSIPTALTRKSPGDSDVDRCMRYLRDEVRLPLAGYEQWPEWSVINTYRIARNCLTHDGGIVPDEHLARLRACAQIELVEPGLLSDDRIVHLLPDTCRHATTTAKAFFEALSTIAAGDSRAAVSPTPGAR